MILTKEEVELIVKNLRRAFVPIDEQQQIYELIERLERRLQAEYDK